MNTDQNKKCGSTEFLNFSDALHHLRWGEKIARHDWGEGHYLKALYTPGEPNIERYNHFGLVGTSIVGRDIMAEDWYVLGDHQ